MLKRELRMFAAGLETDESALDAAQDKILAFNKKLAGVVAANQSKASALSASLAGADFAESAPSALLVEFDNLSAATQELLEATAAFTTFVHSRVPKAAVEDNIGVEVQIIVLKSLKEMEAVLTGKDEKTAFAAPGSKTAYLKARCDVEDKLKPSSDKDKPNVPAPSQKAYGVALDADAASSIASSWPLLQRYGTQAAVSLARNIELLNKPRRESSNFLG